MKLINYSFRGQGNQPIQKVKRAGQLFLLSRPFQCFQPSSPRGAGDDL
jgi:hypothetical protein